MSPEPAQPLPLVSVLMPVRNEAAYIDRALRAVLAQEYPADLMEIFVIDGDSTDGTRGVVEAFQARFANIHLLHNPGRIVPTGMNLALPKARGAVLVRVDGHCVIAPDYVRNCVRHLRESGVDGVGGPMQTVGETPLSETIAAAMSSKFGVGGSAFRTSAGKTVLADTVPFPAYTRDIVRKAGGYDEELVRNQDDEYNYRIRKLGGKILLAADVRSQYYSRGTLGRFWKQYYQYGYWKVRVLQKHPRQMSARQFVPPLFVLALLLGLAGSAFSPLGRGFLALVVGLYLLANLAASALTAARRGWKHLRRLPVVFVILHLSYGLGFLVGLVHFWNRWGDKQGQVPQLETMPEVESCSQQGFTG